MLKLDNFKWRCLLALEEDLLLTQNFVELDNDNAETFSLKYRSIILQACAENAISFNL